MAGDNPYSLSLDSVWPNVLHYRDVFRRAKWSLLGWTLTFMLLGVASAVTTINEYEATVIAMWTQKGRVNSNRIVFPGQNLLGGLGDQLLGNFLANSSGSPQDAFVILKSRNFLTRFVERRQRMRELSKRSALGPDASNPDEARDIPAFQSTLLKLEETYIEFKERISTKVEELTRKLYKPTAFDREILQDSAPTSRNGRRNTKLYKKIRNALKIEQVRRQNLLRLKVRWNNPVVAAELANALVAELNSALRETAITEARKRIAYLNRELDKTSVIPLRQSIYRLIEAETRIIMIAETRIDYAFKVIDSAVPPTLNRHVRPRRGRIIWTTALMGFALGAFWTIWRDSIRRLRQLDEGSRAAR